MRILLFTIFFLASLAKGNEIEELIFMSATGTPRKPSAAPAIITIITENDIKALGARTLDEVLELVPGLHVARTSISVNPTYVMRGNYSTFNQRVLMLIDGISISHLYYNNRGTTWGDMPVNRIEKVEVVRGPGSAVFGADAFTGTINIITKNYSSLENELGVRAGSNNTVDSWWLQKFSNNNFNTALSIEASQTDGSSGVVESDAATTAENNVSHAPAELNLRNKSLDARAEFSKEKFMFRFGYQGRYDVGTGAGHAYALDPEGSQNTHRINGDFSYFYSTDDELVEFVYQASFFHIDEKIKLKIFPDGFAGGAFPNGVIGEPSYKERHFRGEFSSLFHGLEDHTIRLGLGGFHGNIFDIKERKNFATTGAPLGEVIDADEESIFIKENSRQVKYLFLQDEWRVHDFSFTFGLRADHYSDFGETLNKRLAIVWQPLYTLSTKFLYGTAFRPPSFADLYVLNNPVSNGNPDLEAESIETFELALQYMPIANLEMGLNIFQSNLSNLIESAPAETGSALIASNIGEQRSVGVESQIVWSLLQNFYLTANYTWQKTRDETRDFNAGQAPNNSAYLRATKKLHTVELTAELSWVGKQGRQPGDDRDATPGSTTSNINIRWFATKASNLGLRVHNVFDESIKYPANASIYNDLPGRRRSVEAYYRFTW